jgi:hypothetical protein
MAMGFHEEVNKDQGKVKNSTHRNNGKKLK